MCISAQICEKRPKLNLNESRWVGIGKSARDEWFASSVAMYSYAQRHPTWDVQLRTSKMRGRQKSSAKAGVDLGSLAHLPLDLGLSDHQNDWLNFYYSGLVLHGIVSFVGMSHPETGPSGAKKASLNLPTSTSSSCKSAFETATIKLPLSDLLLASHPIPVYALVFVIVWWFGLFGDSISWNFWLCCIQSHQTTTWHIRNLWAQKNSHELDVIPVMIRCRSTTLHISSTAKAQSTSALIAIASVPWLLSLDIPISLRMLENLKKASFHSPNLLPTSCQHPSHTCKEATHQEVFGMLV